MLIRSLVAGFACLLHAGSGFSQPVPYPDPDDPVLSDRLPYCELLARRVATLQQATREPHAEADRLAEEGVRLCAAGRVRQGIRRLRYALLELTDRDADQ